MRKIQLDKINAVIKLNLLDKKTFLGLAKDKIILCRLLLAGKGYSETRHSSIFLCRGEIMLFNSIGAIHWLSDLGMSI
ncbi:Uncharacterised protein [Yersinia rohdei]|uniref:Uncharacterized protein n=1 Tax=Yersinia rohdei TaxID=29485 RepID=A0A0U1HQ74_YERRO|nr:Uncharacterised protein [Yersinia rohdei]